MYQEEDTTFRGETKLCSPKEFRAELARIRDIKANPFPHMKEAEDCSHDWIPTYYLQSNNTRHYRMQCQLCGETGRAIKKTEAPGDVKEFDVALKVRQKAGVAETEAFRKQANREWFRVYGLYLQSPEWKAKRNLVLARDGHRCKACEQQQATQVHHLTYENVCQEILFELISVCEDCHSIIHGRVMDEGNLWR